MRSLIRLVVAGVMVAGAAAGARAFQGTAPPADWNPTPLQREVLGAISGETEIRPGIKLTSRFAPEPRQFTREYLTGVLKRLGLEAQTQPYGTAGGVNLYAVLPATTHDHDDVVILGAHYDTVRVAPGANDDGSGVAAVIGVAQAMTAVESRSRDIIFAFFDEEERGLVGSKAFAQWLKDENRKIHSAHTIDQMGWDSNHNRAIELETPYDGSPELYQQAVSAMGVDIPIFTTTDTSSDHTSFTRAGFSAVGITEEYHHKDTTPFYHKAGDTFATIDFDYLASTTKLLVQVMRTLTR